MNKTLPPPPRLVIAGTHSGCGKTTVTTALMAAFSSLGRYVTPFKVGPDFIDPSFHEFVTGAPSYSLDSWLLSEQTVRHLFLMHTQQGTQKKAPLSTSDIPSFATGSSPSRTSKEKLPLAHKKNASPVIEKSSLVHEENVPLAIIEGVMGLYDGHNTTGVGSTAHVATILHAPTLLVVDGQGMSLSVAALVSGYAHFHSTHCISGIIFNNLSGEKHYKLLADIIHKETDIPCFGFMPRNREVTLKRRHLGLIPSVEVEDLLTRVNILCDDAKRFLDLTGIAHLATSLPFPAQEVSSSQENSSIKESRLFTDATLHLEHDNLLRGGRASSQHSEPFSEPTLQKDNIDQATPLPEQKKASPDPIHSPKGRETFADSRPCQEQDNKFSNNAVVSQQNELLSESITHTAQETKKQATVLPPHDLCLEKTVHSTPEHTKSLHTRELKHAPRIGVLNDTAFSFYYHDNLELLATLGAELIYISPMKETALPTDLDGLYLGGGFPEVFAQELSENTTFRASLRKALAEGLAAYAECGGMMYLMDEIVDVNGQVYPMVGFFNGQACMTKKRGPFGYITVELLQNSVLGTAGTSFRAHEFHHSCIKSDFSPAGSMKKANGESWQGGMIQENTLAWYPHIHFYSFPELAKNFVSACAKKKGPLF